MQGMNSGAMMNQGPPMSTAAGGMMGGNQVGATAGNIEQRETHVLVLIRPADLFANIFSPFSFHTLFSKIYIYFCHMQMGFHCFRGIHYCMKHWVKHHINSKRVCKIRKTIYTKRWGGGEGVIKMLNVHRHKSLCSE